MKQLVLLFSIVFYLPAISQTKSAKLSFDHKITEVEGDLNQDNLPDKVIVTQDTLSETAPYRLQIFFKQPNGDFKLIVSSTKIIKPQYPEGREGYSSEDFFSNVTIKNGILSINSDLLRGYTTHKFRFQNGNFELIGYTANYSDGRGEMTKTDFNLSTGIHITKTQRYDRDKVLSNEKEKIWIRPLPKLQDIIAGENEYY